jgi:hypothetical protein
LYLPSIVAPSTGRNVYATEWYQAGHTPYSHR